MDGRWALLTLVVAAVAAIRLRRRGADGATRAPGERASASPASPTSSGSPTSSAGDASESARPADRGNDPDRGRADDREVEPVEDEAAFDVESVGAALERVWAEHAHDADTILDARLRQLVDRQVPVRGLRRAPGGRAVRVAFADGTVLLCWGSGQGDFGRLGLALHRRSVRLAAFAHVQELTRLEFAWSPDHRLAAVAVGLDQPD